MADVAASCHATATKPVPRSTRGAAFWLGLTAAPSFAMMALITAVSGSSQPQMLCSAHGGSALGGMVPMYLLMSIFHSAPWLKLITRARPDDNVGGEERRPA